MMTTKREGNRGQATYCGVHD